MISIVQIAYLHFAISSQTLLCSANWISRQQIPHLSLSFLIRGTYKLHVHSFHKCSTRESCRISFWLPQLTRFPFLVAMTFLPVSCVQFLPFLRKCHTFTLHNRGVLFSLYLFRSAFASLLFAGYSSCFAMKASSRLLHTVLCIGVGLQFFINKYASNSLDSMHISACWLAVRVS